MSLWTKIRDAVEGEATSIEAVFTPFEQSLIQKFEPLFKQIEDNGEQQLVDLAETTLTSTLPGILASGGNVGAAIAVAAPVVIKQLENDAHTDLKNAAYGMLAATAASLPSAAAPATPAPAAPSTSGATA
jgi:hypothetical protein